MFTRDFRLIDGSIYSFDFENNPAIARHHDVNGSRINELAQVENSLPYWESRFYNSKVSDCVADLDKSTRILDVGCGDGRFTKLLIDMGFSNIYALDANITSLVHLKRNLEEIDVANRVTLVHGNVNDLPFTDHYFGAALSIGVLYYLNTEYERALSEVGRVLEKGALLVETEPDQIGNAVKALLFDGIERFLSVTESHRFIEYFDGHPLELRCFSDTEMRDIHEKAGLAVEDMKSISLFASLLTIGHKKNMIKDIEKLDELRDRIIAALAYYDREQSLAKHKMLVCRKR